MRGLSLYAFLIRWIGCPRRVPRRVPLWDVVEKTGWGEEIRTLAQLVPYRGFNRLIPSHPSALNGWKQFGLLTTMLAAMLLTAKLFAKTELKADVASSVAVKKTSRPLEVQARFLDVPAVDEPADVDLTREVALGR